METGHYESAILICKEAIKNFPNQGPFYLSHSICLVQLGRTEEAVKVIEEGLTRDPEFAKTHKKEDPSEPEGFLN
jgi:predicted Zn-dependent protease